MAIFLFIFTLFYQKFTGRICAECEAEGAATKKNNDEEETAIDKRKFETFM